MFQKSKTLKNLVDVLRENGYSNVKPHFRENFGDKIWNYWLKFGVRIEVHGAKIMDYFDEGVSSDSKRIIKAEGLVVPAVGEPFISECSYALPEYDSNLKDALSKIRFEKLELRSRDTIDISGTVDSMYIEIAGGGVKVHGKTPHTYESNIVSHNYRRPPEFTINDCLAANIKGFPFTNEIDGTWEFPADKVIIKTSEGLILYEWFRGDFSGPKVYDVGRTPLEWPFSGGFQEMNRWVNHHSLQPQKGEQIRMPFGGEYFH